ncbi:MAG: nuclear transport factor 2 family protein [Candidatus Thorarchaeota archaeon]
MPRSSHEVKKLRKTLTLFHQAQETGDEALFLKVWHPEARRFSFGSNNELYVFSTEDILKNQFKSIQQAKHDNPEFSLTFFINRIKHIDIQPDNLIASALVEWQMLSMGQCVGIHYTYYHFIKNKDNWLIVNVTDRGKDIQNRTTT